MRIIRSFCGESPQILGLIPWLSTEIQINSLSSAKTRINSLVLPQILGLILGSPQILLLIPWVSAETWLNSWFSANSSINSCVSLEVF